MTQPSGRVGLFASAFLFACVFIPALPAATIYLSPGGNDGNDGSSWALAKKTLAGAFAAAGSGDTILATNGTYVSTHFAIDWLKSGETLRSVNGPEYTFIDRYDSGMPVIRVEGTIEGFTVRNGNTSSSYKGGGIMLVGGMAVNCIVTNCTAGGDAAGIYINSGGVASNCIVRGNTASGMGGGVFIQNGLLTHSMVQSNVSANRGGGVWLGSSMQAVNCIIRGNRAGAEGGGVFASGSAIIRNCLVAGNQATGNGGGINSDGSVAESCTIVGNTTTASGGGLYAAMGGSVIRNNVMYYNATSDAYLSLSVTLQNSCFGVGVNNPSLGGTASITNAPQFASTGSGYGTNHVFGNYLLRPTSPCVDTGLNQGWMSTAMDLAGTNRIINTTVNMGAYEKTGSGKTEQTITFAEITDKKITDTLTLSATASSGLTVTFSVVSGPATIGSGNRVTFSNTGEVSIKAAQAGNATYDPAPDVIRSFRVTSANPFTLRAVALTNSVVLRWPDPMDYGFGNQTVLVRFSTADYPATPEGGALAYTGTNQAYTHSGRTPGETTYYTIFVSNDGVNFVDPE